MRHLLDRYGSEIHTLMALCREQADLAEPLQHAPDYLAAPRLGSNDERRDAEIRAYTERVEAERAASEQPDDASAAEARAAAPEVVDVTVG